MVVLVGVLAVRVRVLLDGHVALAQVGVGQRDEQHDHEDSENYGADDERRCNKRRKFLVAGSAGGGDDGGNLLREHVLP